MCGIAGIVGHGSKTQIHAMVETIRHRGPDDDGFLIDEARGVYLGMRRLSVIDVGGGKQPIFNKDKTIGVVYNGEIYNYKELRTELEHEGVQFVTQTDTEAIVYLYEKHGYDAFEKLTGMFAIALWDETNKRLVLARDRVGEKPLYYAQDEGTLYFGSELKIFDLVPEVKGSIRTDTALKYFDQMYCGGTDTIFSNVQKLAPGNYAIFENGKLDIASYWKLPHVDDSSEFAIHSIASSLSRLTRGGQPKRGKQSSIESSKEFSDALERLDAFLSDSVKSRLVSDVPLGVFLSGGIDSSLITHYAQQHSTQKVKTFTVMFDDESFNEAPYADIVAEHLGTDHTVEHVRDEQVLSIFDSLPEIMDEPFADSSLVPTYWLSKMTRKHVTVALGGDGGDELFMGYHTFQAWEYWHHLRKQSRLVRNSLMRLIEILPSGSSYFSFDFKFKQGLLHYDSNPYNQHFRWFSPFTKKELNKLFDTSFIKHSNINEYMEYNRSWEADTYASPLSQSAHLYQMYYLPDDIFTKVDRASMATSLETRAPLVDHHLIKFVNELPAEFKYHNNETKFILKKLAERYLPKEIIYRPKHGFPSPIDTWLRGPLKERVNSLFTTEALERHGMFNVEYVQRIWEDFLGGNRYRVRQIWTLAVWQLWSKRFIS